MIHISCYICVTLGVYFSIEKDPFLYIILLNFFSVYFIFHNIYQNDYFSGKIKQKPFSEVIQFLYFICFATAYFQTTQLWPIIIFYNNSFVTYQNSTFSSLTRNLFLDFVFTTRKCANWIKINSYLTLEVNMLNVHVDLFSNALKWTAQNI